LVSALAVLQDGRMEHHVYFWLKDEFKTEAGRARMEAALDELMESPNIAEGIWGQMRR
jgi:hypothetical protein